MAKMGIVQGYDDGFFYPAKSITRAEFATVAMRFDILINGATHGLTDISGHWAEGYIASAYQIGWVDGYEDGSFRPNQPITRTEAAKLINRVLKRRVDQVGLLKEIVIKWPDLEVEHWGYYELMEATISHDYERRYEDRIMEDWTGKGTDMYFATDDIPTPSQSELPPYQPSPGTVVWTEQNTEPEAVIVVEAEQTKEHEVPSEAFQIPKEDYEEFLRIMAILEQEAAVKAIAEAEAKAEADARAATEAEAAKVEMVTLSKEEYEMIMKAISDRKQEETAIPEPVSEVYHKQIPIETPQPQATNATHTVAVGDTLWGLSVKYDTSVAAIKALNGLTSDVVQVGWQLKVR